MAELLDKISSYNIFNNLFPGVVFAIIVDKSTSFEILNDNLIGGLFLYYFLGLVISRFGSLVVEKKLREWGFIKFADYGSFLEASKTDEKIEELSEVNNMYRTLLSLFFLSIIIFGYDKINLLFNFPSFVNYLIIFVIFIILFAFSYKKQTNYIVKRIENIKKGS